MSNEFFNPSNAPGTGAALSSATMRAEFNSVSTGFGKLPTMAANAGKLVHVNSGATALQSAANVTLDSTAMTFGGTSQRIKADFSSSPVGTRLHLQSSTVNGGTSVGSIPNGTSTSASYKAYNSSDPANASLISLRADATVVGLTSFAGGTGSQLPLTFDVNGSERLRLDTSGNLGLGVTPSAWDAGVNALQINGGGFFASNSSTVRMSANLFYNGAAYKHITTAVASYYEQASGSHRWFNAVSNTAGAAATLVQAMTLDASGHLGIGGASGGNRLDITHNQNATSVIALRNTDAGASAAATLQLTNNTKYTNLLTNFTSNYSHLYGVGGIDTGYYSFDTQVLRRGDGTTETLRLDCLTGKVTIGNQATALLHIGQSGTAIGSRQHVVDNAAARSFTSADSDVSAISLSGYGGASQLGITYRAGGGGAGLVFGRGVGYDTNIKLYTNDSTATVGRMVERMQIDSSGNILNVSSGGLGYGTGSGGAVTQITSRTTGVTLDKTNGAITLVSAAGSASWQTFTVTNNKVAATDTIIVNQKSGADLYMLSVTNVAAGSFKISFATTGGTTVEQPVFNFSVIKAVTA